MHQNFAIQTVINSFLSNPSTSPIFATILIEYLLKYCTKNEPEFDVKIFENEVYQHLHLRRIG